MRRGGCHDAEVALSRRFLVLLVLVLVFASATSSAPAAVVASAHDQRAAVATRGSCTYLTNGRHVFWTFLFKTSRPDESVCAAFRVTFGGQRINGVPPY